MNLVNGGGDVKENRTTRDREDPIETGQTAYKRELAYRYLGINPKDVQCVPFLANQLRRIARTAAKYDKATLSKWAKKGGRPKGSGGKEK